MKGRHALVTGGGTGIGAAIARALAAEGAKLTLVGRREETLRATVEELRASGAVGAVFCTADVTSAADVEKAFEEARAANGPISILVNNAGAASSGPFATLRVEEWRAAMAVNLDALLHTCQAALPDLLADEAGRIVNLASTAGLKGYAYTAAYGAAKHGAIGLTRALAAEFARTGLTVNAVCPGFTDTRLVADAVATIQARTGRSEERALGELTRFNPQQRLVSTGEVAATVLWLCLPESRSINGQAIAVAGGEVT